MGRKENKNVRIDKDMERLSTHWDIFVGYCCNDLSVREFANT